MIIALLRHARSIKNVQHRHGGLGSNLLEEAKSEIDILLEHIRWKRIKFKKIYFSPRIQCEQTAKILAESLIVEYKVDERLTPLSLGVIDGLSDVELVDQYPEISKQMTKWRNGKIEAFQLNIPGMEDLDEFFERGTRFIYEIKVIRKPTLIVATRSVLVLLSSILLGRSLEPGGDYREIPWKSCELMTFYLRRGKFVFSKSLSTLQP